MTNIQKLNCKAYNAFLEMCKYRDPVFEFDDGSYIYIRLTPNGIIEWGNPTNGGFAISGSRNYDHSITLDENIGSILDELSV